MKRLTASLFIAILAVSAAGCGGRPCTLIFITVSPPNATADHTLPPPGNQVQFSTTIAPGGCFHNPPLFFVSDPNVAIGSGMDTNAGLATCLGATAGPVTVSASSFGPGSNVVDGTATLTCK